MKILIGNDDWVVYMHVWNVLRGYIVRIVQILCCVWIKMAKPGPNWSKTEKVKSENLDWE